MIAEPQIPNSIAAVNISSTSTVGSQAPLGLSVDKRREVEGVLSELKALRDFLKQSGV
jgi:hypothetical protein